MQECVAAVKARYPGRESQIDQLAARLTRGKSRGGPLFIYGPSSTGKTAVVRDLITALGLPNAYADCTEATHTKPLLCSLLHQLRGSKRRREDGFATSARCSSLAEFLHELPAATSRHRAVTWVVLDNAQRLAGSDLLKALMRLRDATSADVRLIMLSTVPWDRGQFGSGTDAVVQALQLEFPAYRQEQLLKILQAELPVSDSSLAPLYPQFLRLAVVALSRATNNILDLRVAVARLWPWYSALHREGRQASAAALASRIRGDLRRMTSELDVTGAAGPSTQPQSRAPTAADEDAGGAGVDRRASSRGLAFELPYVSKYLLLAAYIASRNKPSTDRVIFDPTYSRRGRKDGQATDRMTEGALEAGLRGPHAFPLERLLHIFYCIYAQRDAEEEEGAGGGAAALAREVQVAEVQMQLSTLVGLRLLGTLGGDPLEGCSYRCNVGDDMARALADNVRLQLEDFLKLS